MCIESTYNDAQTVINDIADVVHSKSGKDEIITAYIHPKGTEERLMLNTVSNIQSMLGVHEYIGHYRHGWKSHEKIYKLMKHHSSWNKTSNLYKNYLRFLYE